MVGDEAYSTPGFGKMIHGSGGSEMVLSSFERCRREGGELDGIDG